MSEFKNVVKSLDCYPDILDARMVSEYMSIGYVKALNLIKYGGIPYKKIGNVYRIHKITFQNWLLNSETEIINLDKNKGGISYV